MENEWIEHDGIGWPAMAKLDDLVQVRFRDGVEQGSLMPATVEWWGTGYRDQSNWRWSDAPPDYNIVAYRVVSK